MISQTELRKLLHYCRYTGVFTWLVSRPPRGRIGARAGYENGDGYRKIGISGTPEYEHRLAFLWMTGEMPIEVDHRNHIRFDNSWNNLRAATRAINSANVAGRRGVRLRNGKWEARYSRRSLGRFLTEEEAIQCRRVAEFTAAQLDPNFNTTR